MYPLEKGYLSIIMQYNSTMLCKLYFFPHVLFIVFCWHKATKTHQYLYKEKKSCNCTACVCIFILLWEEDTGTCRFHLTHTEQNISLDSFCIYNKLYTTHFSFLRAEYINRLPFLCHLHLIYFSFLFAYL